MTEKEREDILKLIHREVVPAIGCTEPIAVALCVAKAKELLGQVPERIEASLSANIIKNAMGVGIPGTDMVGLPIAIALGAIVGKSEYGLEVLRDATKEDVEAGKKFVTADRISVKLEEQDLDKLYIGIRCQSGDSTSEVIIKGHHTQFVYLRKNQEILLDKRTETAATSGEEMDDEAAQLTLKKVYEFATTEPLDRIRFILEAKRINEEAARQGLKENYGHQLGKTLCSPLGKGIMGQSIFSEILAYTSCACDARMAGAMVPVMSNSGSGNQGICTTMPVVIFARENHNTEEELIRALIMSNLTAIYIKQNLGPLSALCGCVVAATGSSCGITLLMGGNYEQISYSVKNMIANLTGMICDGAKPSCALKVTSGVGTAVLSAMLAMQHKYVSSVEGIIDDDVDKSIKNLTRIGSRGMDETDKFVLDIMTHKSKKC